MSLTEKGKRGVRRIIIGLALLVAVVLVVIFWSSITSQVGVLTKRVGDVKNLEQSAPEEEQNVNAEVRETADYSIPAISLPSNLRVAKYKMQLNHVGIMWNATAAACGANGGEWTKQGSLFDKYGKEYGTPFLLKMGRQDDYSIQQDQLAEFAKEYLSSNGKVTNKGAAFVSYMGDNAEIYMQQANKKIDAVAEDLGFKPGEIRAEGFLLAGYSYGEDKAMGLAEWKENPQLALGEVFACYPQDGDQNLIIKWAVDNGLLINPDGSTYCYEAINFAFTDGFMEAARAWGTMTGDRIVVKINADNGKTVKTGEKHAHQILGAGTWTPGDVEAFKQAERSGKDLVSLYSTKDNAHQMPCLWVTINRFISDNPGVIDAIIEGTVRYGDQMKVYDEPFKYAMECMAEVFPEHQADYWGMYFGGIKAETPNGYEIILGGTRACNLSDNCDALGVGENSRNTFQSSYELFGGFMHQLYPDKMPGRLPYAEAINRQPMERVVAKMSKSKEITRPKEVKFASGAIKDKVAERSYSVQFQIGSAELTASGVKAMEAMYKDLNTHDLRITISGHTDNTGSDEVNIPLSERRAQAVVNWLKNKNSASFPSQRFADIHGYGSTRPLPGLDPDSKEGRDKNRRVEITVGY